MQNNLGKAAAHSLTERLAAYFFSKRSLNEFDEMLQMNGTSLEIFLAQAAILGFGLSLATIGLGHALNARILYITIAAFGLFALPTAVRFAATITASRATPFPLLLIIYSF